MSEQKYKPGCRGTRVDHDGHPFQCCRVPVIGSLCEGCADAAELAAHENKDTER